MLERLNVFLGGCGGKGAQDGDCIETLNYEYKSVGKGRRSRGDHLCV